MLSEGAKLLCCAILKPQSTSWLQLPYNFSSFSVCGHHEKYMKKRFNDPGKEDAIASAL
jgi:hypothetical protein